VHESDGLLTIVYSFSRDLPVCQSEGSLARYVTAGPITKSGLGNSGGVEGAADAERTWSRSLDMSVIALAKVWIIPPGPCDMREGSG